MWCINSGLELVRKLQPFLRIYGYHVAIGGGVVNTGKSEKDLDLYFLPLDNGQWPDYSGLMSFLTREFGEAGEPISGEQYRNQPGGCYRAKMKFHPEGRRIDAFVM